MSRAVALVAALAFARIAAAGGPTVVVQPPTGQDVDGAVREALGEMFSERLAKAQVFSSVVSMRDVVDLLRQEQNRQLLGCDTATESCIAEIGGALGSSHLALLDVRRLGKAFVVTAKLLEIGAAKVLFRSSVTIAALESSQPVVEELAQKLAATLRGPPTAMEGESAPALAAAAKGGEAARKAFDEQAARAREAESARQEKLAATGDDMVLVPAGPFLFGCNATVDEACGEIEKPGRNVDLPAFKIDRTEVTHAEYARCVSTGACTVPAEEGYGCVWGSWFSGSDPINCVDLRQARDYCAWKGRRLPSSREWEKAARGADGRRFPWGNEAEADRAQVAPHAEALASVGAFPDGASPFGVLDMAGNVAEWTDSSYDDKRWEYRGGGFLSSLPFARVSDRHRAEAKTRKPDLGFRCAL